MASVFNKLSMTAVNAPGPIFCSDSLCTNCKCSCESGRPTPRIPGVLVEDSVGAGGKGRVGSVSTKDTDGAGCHCGNASGAGGDVICEGTGGGGESDTFESTGWAANGDGPALIGTSEWRGGVCADVSGEEDALVTSLLAKDRGGDMVTRSSSKRA
jgi:hypothetical protein